MTDEVDPMMGVDKQRWGKQTRVLKEQAAGDIPKVGVTQLRNSRAGRGGAPNGERRMPLGNSRKLQVVGQLRQSLPRPAIL